MMDEELQKRNTDCVYFLASPLTCKKGLECEFRHSEIARLNPRDCWFWLARSCLNPTCAFRHPPLEGRPDNSLEPASLPPQAPAVSKSNVPCYFYFNGFCNKGESCSFLHGPANGTPGQLSKAASAATNAPPLENKAIANNEGTPVSVKLPYNQLETIKAGDRIQLPSKVGYYVSAPINISQQHLSPRDPLLECDEPVVKSEILLPAENLGSPLGLDHSTASGDQSSDDQFDGQREPEDRGESSPGFDVLVDDPEKMCYEDDPEYLLAHRRDERVLCDPLLRYDYEEPVAYDPEYPETGVMYEHGDIYGSYNHPDDDHVPDHTRRVSKRSKDMMPSPMALQKRQLFSREVDFNDRNDADLRNHLRKRRRSTSRSKRTVSSPLTGRGQERSGRRHGRQPLEGRLASAVGTDLGGHTENDSHWEDWSRQPQPRYSRSRQQDRDRRSQARPQFIFSEISRSNAASRDERPSQVSSTTTFSGPKTLAQIKEEKRKARENGDSFRSTSRKGRTAVQNFEGPKPLSEILKDKRRLGSTSDDNSSSRSRHDHSESEMNHIGIDVDNADTFAEDDDESLAI